VRNPTALLMVLMFLLAIGAGVVAGKLSTHAPPAGSPVERVVSISDELKLSPAQKDQMRQVWESVQTTANDCTAKANTIQYDYEEAVTRLLDKDQLAKYQELTRQSKAKVKELEKKRRGAFSNAVEQTRKMLNDSQRATYEKIIHDRIGALGGEVAN